MKPCFQRDQARYRPLTRLGLGGVAIGNGFQVNDDLASYQTMEAAWNAGIRYFDTSPSYGMGISEHRMGLFLSNKPKQEYTLSSKVGRILHPQENFNSRKSIWKGNHNFGYRYDYTASGTRRSIEDSLQRMGISSVDIVFIHDISPENADMKENWTEYFNTAQHGAMPELSKMREEGIIKAWGIGVNSIKPILKTLEVADPDILLSATQYSLIHHDEELNLVFPRCEERGISVVVGAPLNAGFLAGKERFDYGTVYPEGVFKKLSGIQNIAERHEVSLLSAALQFCAAPEVVSAVIPGAHLPEQVSEIVNSINNYTIPDSFWEELKMEGLIAENAPAPVSMLG
ncbi:aldo/keto reductase [Mucilaginibacter aquaedulcis]|uniref:aldo/keto reductase n=1 Tax=Mucilaginibacter aquaedulcis TaxID=1187081 RepID=UPI0025B59F18|nr:aldo/keto reductase [Mucilaginibacter aquaedulcis]MDN3549187.1 aldo/keto reductase [Mucilaginibacter aquaedulcis]